MQFAWNDDEEEVEDMIIRFHAEEIVKQIKRLQRKGDLQISIHDAHEMIGQLLSPKGEGL
jgi:hypothetical protein